MGGSGFFKGEKKKPKKDGKNKQSSSISTAPTFTLPKVMEKKRSDR